MSVSEERRRLMAEFEDLKKHLRGSETTNHRDDPFAELARLVEEQGDPYKSVVEPRGQRSAETRQDARDPAERKVLLAEKRILSAPFAAVAAPSEAATSNGVARGARSKSKHPRHNDDAMLSQNVDGADEQVRPRRSLHVMAAIVIVGVAGLAASLAIWREAFPPPETAAIRAEAEPAKLQPERTTGADVPAQDASSLDLPPAALGDNAEQPAPPAQETAPPSEARRDDPGLAPHAASVAAPPAQAQPEEPHGAAAPVEPKEAQTVSVQPGAPLVPNDAPPQAQATTAPSPASRPAAAAPASTPDAARGHASKPAAAIRSGDRARHVRAARPARAKAVNAKPEQVFSAPAEAPAPQPAPVPAPAPATHGPFGFFHSAVDSLTGAVENLGRLATGSRP